MNNVAMWDVIVGFISATFVLPIVQQPRWSTRARAAMTFGYCVVAGTVTAWLTGAFDGVHDVRNGAGSVLLMLVSAISMYHGFAKPTGIAPAIETATALPALKPSPYPGR